MEDDDKGTPARDHHEGDDFSAGAGEAVSDQQGEVAPPSADKPDAGEGRGADEAQER